VFAGVGVVTLIVAALSSVWLFLALQSPSSPLHLGPLVGPIESLVRACWLAGFGAFALAAFFEVLNLQVQDERRIVFALVAGWAVLMTGFVAGAFLGTCGVQVIKAYPRTVTVLLIKLVGFISVSSGFVLLAIGVFRGIGNFRR